MLRTDYLRQKGSISPEKCDTPVLKTRLASTDADFGGLLCHLLTLAIELILVADSHIQEEGTSNAVSSIRLNCGHACLQGILLIAN